MAELDPNDVEALRLAKAELAKWKSVEEALTEKIKAALGDEPEGTVDGHTVVTWKLSAPGVTLDVKKLEEELPESVLAPFRMTKKAARPFKVVD